MEVLLKSGIFYTCGRDVNFRPILVFNLKLIDFKKNDLNMRTVIYVQE